MATTIQKRITAKHKRNAAPAASRTTKSPRQSPGLVSRAKSTAKVTDNKGRVALGGQFANRTVLIEKLSETEILVKLARVIPEREAWLYNNAEALGAVRNGLAQARAGRVTVGPDLDADADLVDQLEG